MRHSVIYFLAVLFVTSVNYADGLVRPPRDYQGSLEETSQEAILIFDAGSETRSAKQDMILKIQVEGDTDKFAWVVPLPNPPKTEKADAKVFQELFNYVQARNRGPSSKKGKSEGKAADNLAAAAPESVQVISREIVGSFDVAVVREKKAGTLNDWLRKEGYQPIDNAEDVIGYYRKKGFVFTCIKVSDAALAGKDIAKGKVSQTGRRDLHPLHFQFETGGRDGILFPMRLTGLQTKPFHVNLYVFHRYWINDKLSRFGYVNHGFRLKYRDWDTRQCTPNGGKNWSDPKSDPLLSGLSSKVPTVAEMLKKHHPGKRFYLTNIAAYNLKPADVRKWQHDLWLFPYYTNRRFIPYDAREGGLVAYK